MERKPHKQGHPYFGIGKTRQWNAEVKSEMKTPMQLLYEQLERTVIQQKGMMSIGEYESFKDGMEMAIAIIEQDGHFEKEKEALCGAFEAGELNEEERNIEWKCVNAEEWFNETFNDKEI